jgi:SAM-dependent methyltransferase
LIDRLQLTRFYTVRRDAYPSIYDAWEEERPYQQWATPAVTDRAYRNRVASLIREAIMDRPAARILSVGCGNAFVEGILAAEGFEIDGVDLHERSVLLAGRRGVHAEVGDVMNWTPRSPDYDLLFIDGVLGHLYDPDSPALILALSRMRKWVAAGGMMIIANDLCGESERVIPSTTGVEFYRFSQGFLVESLASAELTCRSVETYHYGQAEWKRDRLIVTTEGRAELYDEAVGPGNTV